MQGSWPGHGDNESTPPLGSLILPQCRRMFADVKAESGCEPFSLLSLCDFGYVRETMMASQQSRAPSVFTPVWSWLAVT